MDNIRNTTLQYKVFEDKLYKFEKQQTFMDYGLLRKNSAHFNSNESSDFDKSPVRSTHSKDKIKFFGSADCLYSK